MGLPENEEERDGMKLQVQGQGQKSRQALNNMRGELKSWLRFRRMNDDVATGKAKGKISRGRAAQRLPAIRDWDREQVLANDLYTLLAEVMDPRELPDPSKTGSAVVLAEIVVAGKLPDETSPSDIGIIWLWPAVVIFGVGAMVIMYKIKSDAEVLMQKEKMECIKTSGWLACAEAIDFIKIAAVGGAIWFAWEKLGVKKKFKQLTA